MRIEAQEVNALMNLSHREKSISLTGRDNLNNLLQVIRCFIICQVVVIVLCEDDFIANCHVDDDKGI